METQARYTIVGLFTIGVVGAAVALVIWLHGFADMRATAVYRIRFEAPVIGLKPGVSVLFNGLRVGEVSAVRFDPKAPKILMAKIAVDAATPIGPDTKVGVDSESLLTGPTVSLTGGVSAAGLKPEAEGEPPLLIAPVEATETLSDAGKSTLTQIERILAENAKPLHGAIENIYTFSGALERNSGKIDSILAGLEKMTGGGPPAPPPISYTLSAPKFSGGEKAFTLQLALPEPKGLVVFDTQKVLLAPQPNQLTPMEAGQWADSVPRLVQAALVDSFENAGFAHFAKAMDGFTADAQLLLEIRAFQLAAGPPPQARIEIGAKWLGADGKVGAQKSFSATAPAMAADGAAGAAALNEAFQSVARDIVAWSRGAL